MNQMNASVKDPAHHPLSLKIWRLTRPALASAHPLTADAGADANRPWASAIQELEELHPHLTGALTTGCATNAASTDTVTFSSSALTTFPLTEALEIPSTFGNLHLGETMAVTVCLGADPSLAAASRGDHHSGGAARLPSSSLQTENLLPSRTLITDIALKIELQTSTQRWLVHDTTTEPHKRLHPGENLQTTVRHELREVGMHVLICTVYYSVSEAPPNLPALPERTSSPAGSRLHSSSSPTLRRNSLTPRSSPRLPNATGVDLGTDPLSVHAATHTRQSIRRFFKFQVINPLVVKTKVHHTSLHDQILLETQVQNATESPMYIEQILFDPAAAFICQDLNYCPPPSTTDSSSAWPNTASTSHTEAQGPPIYGPHDYLGPHCVRQYLYALHPRSVQDHDVFYAANLGKIDLVWRGPFGAKGRLQTSTLTRKLPEEALRCIHSSSRSSTQSASHAPAPSPASATDWLILHALEPSPAHVIVEKPFYLTGQITNTGTELVQLQLTVSSTRRGSTLLVYGASTVYVGTVEPQATVPFQCQLIPLATGSQAFGGIQVRDLLSGTTREWEHITDVLVHAH
ncbi:hypothetical protein H4R34_004606 [Dimargaris verticillata]|uniref:DUF974-domain-containing protein n=1 Tax=Dimargaris verticillata TaxID=2761393 RepID=A0A9W8AYK4_9FUNG|nr:hypothetical protein H4R34_004606 [Dimargaris verticillata]